VAANSLTIVIPALNEEEAIAATISRCQQASGDIERAADLEFVEIIVVSDGSTDRTAEIARGFSGVTVIEFEKNRGYGAAIMEGFRQGRGTLVGFLDADGTCDPRYFGVMCRRALGEQFDIVLGSRMGRDSRMPRLRRVGNRVYAALLGLLCGRYVTDTASGMRVLRRSALEVLYPLPTGLHFTPAMSARALMNGLRVAEVPMKYDERVGRSKLSVLRDGVRFLQAIVTAALCYRPEGLFLMGFMACLLVSALLAMYPIEFYLENRFLREWMIYRFLVCFLLGSVGFLLLCAAALAQRMVSLRGPRRDGDPFWGAATARLFSGRVLWITTGLAVVCSIVLVWPGVVEYVRSGQVTLHWSRVIVAAFGLLLAFQAILTRLLLEMLDLWAVQDLERRGVLDRSTTSRPIAFSTAEPAPSVAAPEVTRTLNRPGSLAG
jgi:glycosyltransferase involved in cell wall biosynthesis